VRPANCGRAHARTAAGRADALHRVTARLVRDHAVVAEGLATNPVPTGPWPRRSPTGPSSGPVHGYGGPDRRCRPHVRYIGGVAARRQPGMPTGPGVAEVSEVGVHGRRVS
jgi:hypothetical protein